jgi:hypothetical protein
VRRSPQPKPKNNRSSRYDYRERRIVSQVKSHTDARHNLVAGLVRAEGVDQKWAADAIAPLVEGAFAAGAARRDTAVVKRAARAAERVLSLAAEGIPSDSAESRSPGRGNSGRT